MTSFRSSSPPSRPDGAHADVCPGGEAASGREPWLRRAGRALWTAWCVVWLPVAVSVHAILIWPILLPWGLIRRQPVDEIARIYIQHFGRLTVRALWPLFRVRVRGQENMPETPFVLVINHRSFCDAFLSAFVPRRRFVIFVRAWPFRMWVMGTVMRMAGYKDIEAQPIEAVLEGDGRRHLALGDSFVFYPEGHRSKTGRLQRFRLGAFRLAARYELPVVPLCIEGSEQLMAAPPWVSPARVTLTLLPPVDPGRFAGDGRDVQLRDAVFQIYKDFLGE